MAPKAVKTAIPPARIKKIMRLDDEVGKVSSATPILIAKATESFLEALVKAALVETLARDAKKMTASHVKKAVLADAKFDFLKEKVEHIPDPQQNEAEVGGGEGQADGKEKKPRKARKKKDAAMENDD